MRSWDRNQTSGHALTDYPGSVDTPGPGRYAQTLHGMNNTTNPTNAIASPWRWVSSGSDPAGNAASTSTDAGGYPTSSKDARGDTTTYSYDADGDLTSVLQPVEAGLPNQPATSYTYDAFDEKATVTSPSQDQTNKANGVPAGHSVSARYYYDAVGRLTETDAVRDLSPSGSTPPACYVTGSGSDPALPTGALVCTTQGAYDSVNNLVWSRDGDGQVSTFTFDAHHRQTDALTPAPDPQQTGASHSHTDYDADGNVTTACSPRQYTEGDGTCTENSTGYLTHYSYDFADRQLTSTVYRSPTGGAETTTSSYDADGNLISLENANQKTTNYLYDSLDRRYETDTPRNADGFSYTHAYELYAPSGDLIAHFAPGTAGDNKNSPTRVTGYSYDADHRVIDTVTGLQVSLTDPTNPFAVTNLPAVNDAMGNATATGTTNTRTRTVYDADGNIVASYEPRAFVDGVYPATSTSAFSGVPGGFSSPYMTRTDFDADNRPTARYSPRTDGTVTDPNAAALDDNAPEGNQCTGSGPSDGRLPTYPSGTRVCETTASYTPDGQPDTTTLPTATTSTPNRNVSYSYTADDLLADISGPDPAATSANGSHTTLVSYTRDGNGRVLTSTDPLGVTTSMSYSPAGTVVETDTSTSSTGVTHKSTQSYDANGESTSQTLYRTPAGTPISDGSATEADTTTTSYTPDGLVASVQTPGDAPGEYDTTSYAYDSVGNQTQVTPPAANASPHDANNTAGSPVTYSYTDDNLLASQTVPVSPTGATFRQTTYKYDPAGRDVQSTTSVVGPKTNGNYPVLTAGQSQSFGYAPNDRRTSEDGRSDSGTQAVTYGYDAAGDITCWLDGPHSGSGLSGDSCDSAPADTARVSASYYLDGLTRQVVQTPANASARTTSYSYDGAGNLTARADDTTGHGSQTTTYTDNDAGLALSMTSGLENAVNGNGSTTWTYNHAGQPTTQLNPNGTKQTWSYDSGDDTLTGTGLASSASNAASGTDDLVNDSYTYDEAGRILTDAHSGTQAGSTSTLDPTAFSYTYHRSGRLASFTNGAAPAQNLTWDHDGNRLSYGTNSYTYNADDSLATSRQNTGVPLHAFVYDTYGRLTADGCATYSYDGLDRLASESPTPATGDTSCPQGAVSTPDTVSYSYDGLDRQTSRSETSGAPGSQTTRTTGLYYDGTSQTTTGETSSGGSGPDGLDYVLDAAGDPQALDTTGGDHNGLTYLNADGTGNITTVTNAAGGATAVTCQLRYDPYGNPVDDNSNAPRTQAGSACTSGTTTSDVLYKADRQDPSTGNYQLGARTYNPATGSYTTPDAYRGAPGVNQSLSSDPLTANSYTYVNGDPINLVDPTGHFNQPNGGGCGQSLTVCAQEEKAAGQALARDARSQQQAKSAYVNGMRNNPGLCEAFGADASSSGVCLWYAGQGEEIARQAEKNAPSPWSSFLHALPIVGCIGDFTGGSSVGTKLLDCGSDATLFAGPLVKAASTLARVGVGAARAVKTVDEAAKGLRELDTADQTTKAIADGSKVDDATSPLDTAGPDSDLAAQQKRAQSAHQIDAARTAGKTATRGARGAANTEEGLVGAGRSLGPGAAHVSDPAFGGGFDAPSTFLTRDGELSNGSYTVSSAKMAPHMTGSLAAGKSQFLYWVDAQTAALDAASYADEAGLWVGNKATVFIENGPVGVLGNTGELTDWLNIYRTDTGFIHASPGNGP